MFLLKSHLLFFCGFIFVAGETPQHVRDWKVQLRSGDFMPMIGLGTSGYHGKDLKQALDLALEVGYRQFDTAEYYDNEADIGNALKELLPKHNLTRKDIFLTSKVNISDTNPDAYRSVQNSLRRLQTDYVDLYLIHHPAIRGPNGLTKGPNNAVVRAQKWKGLVKAQHEGLVRNIGVSNYGVKHLKELLANDYGVKPSVNQIHWAPANQPKDILEFCNREGIYVEAYSSLGGIIGADLRSDPKIVNIAKKLGKTTTQILLRWPLQLGIIIIPKSKSKKHLEENLDLDFTIPEEDMEVLSKFEQQPSWFKYDEID